MHRILPGFSATLDSICVSVWIFTCIVAIRDPYLLHAVAIVFQDSGK